MMMRGERDWRDGCEGALSVNDTTMFCTIVLRRAYVELSQTELKTAGPLNIINYLLSVMKFRYFMI